MDVYVACARGWRWGWRGAHGASADCGGLFHLGILHWQSCNCRLLGVFSDPCFFCAIQVYCNVYDLSPANDYGWGVGLGAFHSGIEVYGVEDRCVLDLKQRSLLPPQCCAGACHCLVPPAVA